MFGPVRTGAKGPEQDSFADKANEKLRIMIDGS
jgi:hypothetical protein